MGYCFSTYSPALKAELGLSQTALGMAWAAVLSALHPLADADTHPAPARHSPLSLLRCLSHACPKPPVLLIGAPLCGRHHRECSGLLVTAPDRAGARPALRPMRPAHDGACFRAPAAPSSLLRLCTHDATARSPGLSCLLLYIDPSWVPEAVKPPLVCPATTRSEWRGLRCSWGTARCGWRPPGTTRRLRRWATRRRPILTSLWPLPVNARERVSVEFRRPQPN